jgi:hypothetical protein
MPRDSRRAQAAWKVVSGASGVLGAIGARKALQALWPAGKDGGGPPFNPADRRVAWTDALQWTLAAAIGGALARLVSERLAAAGWEAATGSPPPGIQT